MSSLLLSAIVLAFVGSVHCVGMCGGFPLAIAQATVKRRALPLRQLMYHFGKITAYALLGAVAGSLGGTLAGLLDNAQRTLSIALGIALVLVGLGLIGIIKGINTGAFAHWRRLTRKMGKMLQAGTKRTLFVLGMLNGVLPCGLVYGAMALAAASGGAGSGALIMGIFGVATMPALLALAFLGTLLKPMWRSRMHLASGIVIILLGVVTLYRGVADGHTHNQHQNHHATTEHVTHH